MTHSFKTIAEIAAELRVSDESVRRAIYKGILPARQVSGPGSAWRVDRRDYRDYLTKTLKAGGAAGNAAVGSLAAKSG